MIGCLPSCENKLSAPLAQSVEHLPFKQGVRGSNPRRGTKKSLETERFPFIRKYFLMRDWS